MFFPLGMGSPESFVTMSVTSRVSAFGDVMICTRTTRGPIANCSRFIRAVSHEARVTQPLRRCGCPNFDS